MATLAVDGPGQSENAPRFAIRADWGPVVAKIFDGLLADLRMQYVSLTSTRQPNAPRGFTGSDITGGR